MKMFEYKRISLEHGGVEGYFALLGADSWELVSVNNTHAFFKRERVDETKKDQKQSLCVFCIHKRHCVSSGQISISGFCALMDL